MATEVIGWWTKRVVHCYQNGIHSFLYSTTITN